MSNEDCVNHVKMLGDNLFSKRMSLLSLWQELAENFYPARADFTRTLSLGTDRNGSLMTSAPVIARRNLANAFSTMLRPTAKPWFNIRSRRPDQEDTEAKQYLEKLTRLQKDAMYDSRSGFVRATKTADNDFATFGQAVLQCELYRPGDGSQPHLLHRCWHLRDCAWMENDVGLIDTMYRQWTPTATTLSTLFRDKIHPETAKLLEKTPYQEVKCWHVVMPSKMYATFPGAKKFMQPFVSMIIDVDNVHMIECVGQWSFGYVVPRWEVVSGSQYANSPATDAAVADARLLQQITHVILEAGEKAVNPPMVAVQDAIRGDVPIYAGGITWVDADYDERTGEALRPMASDHKGLTFGHEMIADLRMQIGEGFFLNKLNLPPQGGPDMTAYEVGQRVQEYIRNALPLFEPVEMEYNAKVCEEDLGLLMRADPVIAQDAPPSMRGQTVEFQFESPLREAIDKMKVGQMLEASQVLTQAMQLDPSVAMLVDMTKGTRDVLTAVIPAAWMRTESEVDILKKKAAQQAAQQQMMQGLEQAAGVAKTASEAAGNTADMMGLTPQAGA